MSDNVKVLKQSFDRTNIQITVKRKPPSGGYRAALQPLVDELVAAQGRGQSTIIYCPTRSDVEEVAAHLSRQLESGGDSKGTFWRLSNGGCAVRTVPCRHDATGPIICPHQLFDRQDNGDCCHHCVRPWHRQTGHEESRSLGGAKDGGRILPAARSCRTRWPSSEGVDVCQRCRLYAIQERLLLGQTSALRSRPSPSAQSTRCGTLPWTAKFVVVLPS